MSRLGDTGEFAAIRRLLEVGGGAGASGARAAMAAGPGDDAALLVPRPGHELVATTDTMLEGVHYLRGWIDAAALGARLAEANLSDLAAMAAEPRWALVSIGARADHDVDDLVAIQRGIVGALAAAGAVVAGGNLTAVAGEEWLTLALLGEVEAGRAWRRSGARAGDLVAITGSPGRAGAGSVLAGELGEQALEPRWSALLDAWRAPRSRVAFARALAPAGVVRAAIDVSDGVSGDLAHLCAASGVGARLDAAAWPADDALDAASVALEVPREALALGASDDYELVLAVDPAGRDAAARIASEHGVPLAFVGTFTADARAIEWVARDGSVHPVEPGGYDHYARG